MNKSGTSKFSNTELKREAMKNNDDLLEYCNICFIALGSQEKRIYMNKNVAHPDCAKKTKSKKRKKS